MTNFEKNSNDFAADKAAATVIKLIVIMAIIVGVIIADKMELISISEFVEWIKLQISTSFEALKGHIKREATNAAIDAAKEALDALKQ